MDSEFSEFSYGYAATRQAVRDLSIGLRRSGAPSFPSLLQEFDLGYDVKLPFVEAVVCLQFKRSTFVSRRNPASPTWSAVGGPHERVSLDADGHQHRALVQLENRLRKARAGYVFYLAPRFHTVRDFDRHYMRSEILTHSTFLLPSELAIGSGRHHLTYSQKSGALVHSTPRRQERPDPWEPAIQDIAQRSATRDELVSEQRSAHLEKLASYFGESLVTLEREQARKPKRTPSEVMEHAAAALGMSLIIMRPTDSR